jgi:hypothetical protein
LKTFFFRSIALLCFVTRADHFLIRFAMTLLE